MTRFRVWAPKARQVEVETLGRRYPMAIRERGWWFADVPQLMGMPTTNLCLTVEKRCRIRVRPGSLAAFTVLRGLSITKRLNGLMGVGKQVHCPPPLSTSFMSVLLREPEISSRLFLSSITCRI